MPICFQTYAQICCCEMITIPQPVPVQSVAGSLRTNCMAIEHHRINRQKAEFWGKEKLGL